MVFLKKNLDKQVNLSFRIFQQSISLAKLLSLKEGKIAMKQLLDEKIDICIGNSVIAEGQLLLKNGSYNIKITKII